MQTQNTRSYLLKKETHTHTHKHYSPPTKLKIFELNVAKLKLG